MVKAKKVIDLTGTSKKTPASKIKKAHKKATRKSPRELKGKERYKNEQACADALWSIRYYRLGVRCYREPRSSQPD